jgi:hypothetical protein
MITKVLNISRNGLVTSSCITLILLLAISFSTHAARSETDVEETITLVREVYSKLLEAEAAGADIYNATLALNKALTLIKSINENPADRERLLREAVRLVRDVDSTIPALVDEGRRATFLRNFYMVLAISLTASLATLSYLLTPRIFWRFWLKTRKNWLIRLTGGVKGNNDRRRS